MKGGELRNEIIDNRARRWTSVLGLRLGSHWGLDGGHHVDFKKWQSPLSLLLKITMLIYKSVMLPVEFKETLMSC